MRKFFLAFALLASFPLLTLNAQQPLNNGDIIKLVKSGLSDDFIISTISSQPGNFDASTEAIIALKNAGASDRVMSAVVQKVAGTASATPPSATRQPTQGLSPTSVPAPSPTPTSLGTPTPQPEPPSAATMPMPGAPLPAAKPEPFHSTDGKLRIYVTDRPIFESDIVVRGAAGAGHKQAGDDPRVVEVEADIFKVCPRFIVASNNQDRADLILVFRRRGGSRSAMFAFGGLTGLALSGTMKVDGASLFQPDGDMVYATKQGTVEKAIKDTCAHIPPPK